MDNQTLITIIIAVISSQTLSIIVTHILNKNSALKKTLAALSYFALSMEVERLLSKGHASPEERHELEIMYEAYKANGWNGDMTSRVNKVFNLPIQELQ